MAIPVGLLKRAAVPAPFTKPGPSMVPTNCEIAVPIPVPERLIRVGGPAKLEAMLRLAALAPAEVGLNVTDMVQVAAGVTEAHVVVGVNAAASVPVVVTPETTRLAFPVFVRVTTKGELVVFAAWSAKARLDGERLTKGAALVYCPTSDKPP